MLTATVTNGELTLSGIPYDDKGIKSTSGKSNVHASTRGNQSVTLTNGKKKTQVSVGINVYSRV